MSRPQTYENTPAERLNRVLRMRQLTAKVPYAPSTIYGLVAAGKFPAPFKLIPGDRAAGWLESEVDAWIAVQADKGMA